MAYESRLELSVDSRTGEKNLKRMEGQLERTERAGDGVSKSVRGTNKRFRSLAKVAKLASGAMVGLTAGAGSLTLIAQRASEAAAQIDNLSKLGNTSAETFQRMTYASASVGVEQEKLADILKDTNDRVGDFLSTGGGEMAEFFETIGPKIGITADQFRNLSGPDALQKFYNGLEEANLSQAEMTFYMESIADEATALIPLLRDNGREMNRLSDEADDMNVVLSNMEIQRLKDIRGEFRQLGQQISTETSRAVLQFDDLMKSSLEGISEGVAAVSRGFNAFMDSFRDDEAKKSIAGIDAELNALFDTRERLRQRIDMFGEDSEQARDSKAAMEELKAQYDVLTDRKKELLQAGPVIDEPEIVSLSRASTELKTLNDWLFETPAGVGETSTAMREASSSVDEFALSLRSLEDELFPAEAAQRQFREDQLLLQQAMFQGVISLDRYAEAMRRLNNAHSTDLTGGFMDQVATGGPMQGGGQEDDYWSNWLSSAEAAFTDFDQMNADLASNFTRGFGDMFADVITQQTSFKEGFASLMQGVAQSAVSAIGEMIAQWLAYQAVTAAVGVFGGGGGASAGGIYANLGGFASGGWTGPGAANDPAGVVHAGEFVVRKRVVEQPGVKAMLESLNRGYQAGGHVAPRREAAPRESRQPEQRSQPQQTAIYNMIDVDSMAQAVMASPQGRRGIVNVIKAERGQIKTVLGG